MICSIVVIVFTFNTSFSKMSALSQVGHSSWKVGNQNHDTTGSLRLLLLNSDNGSFKEGDEEKTKAWSTPVRINLKAALSPQNGWKVCVHVVFVSFLTPTLKHCLGH